MLKDDLKDLIKATQSQLGIAYKESIRDSESTAFSFEFPHCKWMEDLARRDPESLLKLSLTGISFSGGFYFNFKTSDGQSSKIRADRVE